MAQIHFLMMMGFFVCDFLLIFSGPTQDSEKDLNALCMLWLESKDHVVVKVSLCTTSTNTFGTQIL